MESGHDPTAESKGEITRVVSERRKKEMRKKETMKKEKRMGMLRRRKHRCMYTPW